MYPNGLSGAVEVSFGCRVGNMRALEGGEESEIFLVDTEIGERVLASVLVGRSSAVRLFVPPKAVRAATAIRMQLPRAAAF
jgi:hypothetical protein